MIMQALIYYGPDFLMAVLSCWLGLSLLVRAPRDRTTRAFAWFCLWLAVYGMTAILPRLTPETGVQQMFDRAQLIATVLTPPAFLHFILYLVADRYATAVRRFLPSLCYTTGLLLALYAALGDVTFGQMTAIGVRTEPVLAAPWTALAWFWIAQRSLPLLLAVILMRMNYRQKLADEQEQLLQRIFEWTAVLGVSGAFMGIIARMLSEYTMPGLLWIISHGVSRTLILIAMVVLAYAMLSYRALLPTRVARRTFFFSMAGSLVTALYVSLLLLLEWQTRRWLQIDMPLVTILAMVFLVASLNPLSEWFRAEFDRRFYRREFDYGRLVQTLSDDVFQRGELDEQLHTTLTAVCRALGVREGLIAVATAEGLVIEARYGPTTVDGSLPAVPDITELQTLTRPWIPWPAAQFLLPLRRGTECLGLMALGPRYSEQTFTTVERGLLDYLSSYLALVISHAHARAEQQSVMAHLAEQSRLLEAQQEELARQTAAATREREAAAVTPRGLVVYALGSLRVERDGEVITRWGGDKAGTHQAEALFAFLFDRRGKGITKDEAAEIIWPDAGDGLNIEKTDSAFHRTLAALRRTLEPDLSRASKSQMIQYHHGRYWLEPAVVSWCDTEVFVSAVEQGINEFHQGRFDAALMTLRHAVQLYRGDYMDDCPFFGDSYYVEEQREILLARYIQGQLALSVLYELQGRVGEATSAYQEAEVAYRRVLLLNPDYAQDIAAQRAAFRTHSAAVVPRMRTG